jgi:hypothetical protein
MIDDRVVEGYVLWYVVGVELRAGMGQFGCVDGFESPVNCNIYVTITA